MSTKEPAGPYWFVAVVLLVTSVIKQQLAFSEKKVLKRNT